MKIHKAATPKKNYWNPTMCVANVTPKDAHEFSRVNWDKVTCKNCLKWRGKKRVA